MDVVDCQVHIGPGGIDETLAAMDALGIRALVVDEFWMAQVKSPGYVLPDGGFRTTAPTAELAVALHPDRFSYLLRIDHRDPELGSLVRTTAATPGARAFRVIPGMSAEDVAAFGRGDYHDLFAAVADSGLPLFVYIPGGTAMLEQYAKRFPEMRIVIDHCGMPQRPQSDDAAVLGAQFEAVLRLADYPNVALKWAHAPAMFATRAWPGDALRPVLRRAIDAFGAERIMWASDFNANQSGDSWGELLWGVRANPDLSQHEMAQILGGTARRWLNWAN